jgi:hypothetical protein
MLKLLHSNLGVAGHIKKTVLKNNHSEMGFVFKNAANKCQSNKTFLLLH